MATYCIECKTTPAYISYLGNCECSNPVCRLYSSSLYPQKTETEQSEPTDDLENNTTNIYLWSTHHHDFGDV